MSKMIRAMKKVYWKGRKKIKKLPPVKAVKKYMGRKRKDKLLYETLPAAYNAHKNEPVDERKVIFIELRLPDVSNSFRILYDELQRDFDLDIHVHLLRNSFVPREEYIRRCKEMLADAATAKYIFVNEASDVLSCVDMRPETIVTQLWHACGAFKKFGMSTAELIFNDVKVPKENLLGKEGDGFKIAMSTLDGGRIGIAAQALGIAQGAFEHALSYSKERVQFGKPIAAQQSIAFKLADMATKLRCARFLIYSAAELKEQHAPYGMESAMAKMYASDIALEVTNDALQIHGGSGYLKGMEVERAYRDAKITTLYEGTNEIQRVVIASHLLGRLGKSSGGESRSAAKKPAPITGIRKKTIFREGDAAQQVADLVAALKKDGHDFSVGIPMDTPIPQAERVVSAGKGIGEKKNMKLVESLAKAAGAAIGSSRPVAETLKYLPLNRYVGMSGQKFTGNLYIACGISGASQHLKGIKDASTIVAINKNGNAPIFKNCDYGIVGDVEEILPLLTAALDSGEKLPAPPMVKMKRPTPPKPAPIGDRYVCSGCGYEYVPELGDEDGEIAPGTLFEQLPAEWVCPECAETKDQFVKA